MNQDIPRTTLRLIAAYVALGHNGTTYSIVTGNLANHKVVAKLADGDKYETLEISDQEVTYFQEYCYRQLYQTYQARLDV